MLDLIKLKTKKLATQLVLSFFIAMVVPMTIATIFSIVYFSNEIKDHAMQKMRCEGQMATLIYDNSVKDLQQLAKIYARKNDTLLLFSTTDNLTLQKSLNNCMLSDKIDMLTLVDISRKAVSRIHYPDRSGDTLAETPLLNHALSEKSSVAVETFSEFQLRHEGFRLPKNIVQSNLLVISAASPVYNRNRDKLIGAIIIRKKFFPGNEIIQSIGQQLRINTALYHGVSYMGAILTGDEENFYPVPEMILKKTLIDNKPTFYANFIQNGYLNLILPVNNIDHHPVALIVIQRSAHDYVRAQHIAMFTHIFILCLAILLGFIFRKHIERRILIPLNELQNGAKQIRNGDYKYRLSVKGIEEIEHLALAFNEMTIELQDKQDFLTRTEKKYRGIFENAVEGIFQMMPDGRFLDVNPAMARILGYASHTELLAEITDMAKQTFVTPDDLTRFRHILAEELQLIDFETQLYQKTGHKIWCSISARAVFDTEGEVLIKGDLLYYEGTLLDISNRKERERAEQARNAAEMANQAKTDFLARMSHEIRTPMNAILGMAEMLQNSSLTPEQKRYVDLFSSSGKLLLSIINDILDFSKIEANQLSIESIEFDLVEIIENIGRTLSFKAHEKALEFVIHIEPDVPRYVIGDPVRVQQILMNLTGNAIKFTQKGQVVLTVATDPKQLNTYIFSVEDTGIGIDKSYHTTIFESFSQADTSTTRHYGGTGLGLAISKKLVALMKGRLWFYSEPSQGTSFYFSLSFDTADKDDPPTRMLQKFVGKNVMIIEKNMRSAKALEARLKYWHMQVECYDCTQTALTHFNNSYDQCRPDLVFINQRLPDDDPFALKEKILQRLPIKPLFIILFSSDNDIIKKEKSKQHGFDAFLNKPIMIADLDRALDISTRDKRDDKPKILPDKKTTLNVVEPLHILVADDHLSNRKVIEIFLKNDPVVLDFALNGQEAVEKFMSKPFDMIIMDMEMPVLNGLKATQEIRQIEALQEREKSIPIIFLTAHALDEHQNKCYGVGGTACLTKPVKYQKIIETIQEYAVPVSRIDSGLENNDMNDPDKNNTVETELNTPIDDLNEYDILETDPDFDMPDFSDVDVQNSMAELLPFFIESTQKDLVQIKNAMEENDLETVRRVGHSLKGASGAYGQDEIGQIGASIETAALAGDRQKIITRMHDLDASLNQLVQTQQNNIGGTL
jgi:PAS domain S-box-containing protein